MNDWRASRSRVLRIDCRQGDVQAGLILRDIDQCASAADGCH
jgi:hypothetical protein